MRPLLINYYWELACGAFAILLLAFIGLVVPVKLQQADLLARREGILRLLEKFEKQGKQLANKKWVEAAQARAEALEIQLEETRDFLDTALKTDEFPWQKWESQELLSKQELKAAYQFQAAQLPVLARQLFSKDLSLRLHSFDFDTEPLPLDQSQLFKRLWVQQELVQSLRDMTALEFLDIKTSARALVELPEELRESFAADNSNEIPIALRARFGLRDLSLLVNSLMRTGILIVPETFALRVNIEAGDVVQSAEANLFGRAFLNLFPDHEP